MMRIIRTLQYLMYHPINKSQKIKALIRFVKWQIASRLTAGSIVFDWIDNAKVIVKSGDTGMTGNIYAGLHEFSDMAFLLHVLNKEDLFIDIGANIGSYTILASSVVGCKSVCFEPVPLTYQKLVMNIKINNLEDKVVALNKALGEEPDTVSFTTQLDCMNHIVAQDCKNDTCIEIQLSTLDIEIKDEQPFMIKIDVEGYETPTLLGARKVLENKGLSVVIMELNGSGSRYGYDESEILKIMHNYGFKMYSYEPFTRTLHNLGSKNKDEGNTIFIKNEDLVLARIKQAEQKNIYGILV